MDSAFPLTHEVVLIGGGHTHALVLRKWGMRPLAGARLTLINPGPTAPYTGMLPGFVAGHYGRDDLSIDLVRLARFAGARLILGQVTGIDRAARRIKVPGRPPVAYDLASINIGITSDLPDLPGFTEHAIAAKPLGLYARRWMAFKHEVAEGGTPAQIAVIGGGVGGVELALAMSHALRDHAPQIAVIDRNRALDGVAHAARSALLQRMEAFGVGLIEHASPSSITAEAVHLADGLSIPARLTVGAAGARPFDWLVETGLTDDAGFLQVSETLQTSDPAIFAAGDCAQLPDPRPKAGVFAVREAPVLYANLRAAAMGRRLRPFRPQRDYLKLVSLGGKQAVADKWGGKLVGGWVWHWKDRIDRAFMNQFRRLKPMAPPALPRARTEGLAEALGPKPMCGGCGAKVGGAALGDVLAALPQAARTDVTTGPGDDAAILATGGAGQVLTTDHLRALTLDPYTMARIAAVHALGDIWAMGAAPQAATATVILPRMTDTLQRIWLGEIMAGAAEVMGAAGAQIVGGHTSLGSELTLGFTVTGLLDGPAITHTGAQVGDRLILTKPLGSGVLMAAEMQLAARGDWVARALDHMTAGQGIAAKALGPAHAMTDVTGFGLAGHLMAICRASDVGAQVDLATVPLMEGALELASRGVRSTLYSENRRVAEAMTMPDSPATELFFDPQTSGGLLAAVAPDAAQEVLAKLRAQGVPAAEIGEITAGPPQITVR